ncbi:uncharacterized protein PFL1_06646 [Pseudozyma flocculosa PF-1]|uniref:Related to 80 kDa nuclear cap binding protein n=2 Tax=Pseudozyma flocculosa TaxID=84751 RepID=A0A5C3F7P2_9BASI|nr:uncharacterized protein PFL1_06646 [Pseudozyma flocculosa PF-1]EPQ25779.1 hypothetical protein PFL1_06646 [Pseudozyma flocculosa PF-1]SPO40524.1 related to 80 kDa nuclear cap binding protein [Pseudozyma flocculosa]
MADRNYPYGQAGGGGYYQGGGHQQSPYSRPRRGGGGGGGGRGGGYYGGGGGGHHHHQQTPQHTPESRAEQKARQLKLNLYKLGEEKDFHPPSDLLKLSRWIQERAKDGVEPVNAAFRIMVVEQPHKIPLIAALIGFLCLSPNQRRDAERQDPAEHDADAQVASKDDTVGITVVKDLVRAFRTYLDARLWRNTRLSLHLFAALVPLRIISASSLRTLLSSFAAVLDEPGVAASRGDRAAICIIEMICRGGQDLLLRDDVDDVDGVENGDAASADEGARQELDALVEKVTAYNASRKVEYELAAPFSVDAIDGNTLRQESFEDCVRALEACQSQGYTRPAFLPTPSDLLPAAISPSASKLPREERSVSLPDVLVPPDEDLDASGVDVAFASFGETAGERTKRHARSGKLDIGKGEADQRRAGSGPERVDRQARWFVDSVPQPGTPSSVVLRAILADMIDLYEVNRKDAARLILDLPSWLRRGTFGGKVSPDAGLFGESDEEWWYVERAGTGQTVEGGWSLDDLIVESVVSTSLVLPTPPRNALYYTALLREVVSVTPGTIAPSLGRTIRTFYSAMGDGRIDAEVLDRFADWFSIHLSNFNFGWAWKEWIGDAALPASHPRRAFSRRIVELEVRLAYYDRIKQTLPEEIAQSSLAPEEPLPAFTYADESHPYHAQASRLINSIRAKAAAPVIMADFESFKASIRPDPSSFSLPDAGNDDGGIDAQGKVESEQQAEAVVRDIAIQAVLFVGSRSFSHFLNIVERYHALLRQLSSSPRMRIAILCGATRFWARSAQWVGIVIDKLLQYRIVEPADVVDFVFSPPTDEPAPVLLGSGDGVPHSFSRVPAVVGAGSSQRDWSSFNWWLIIRLTLKKVNGRVDQLQKRLEDIEREEALEQERKEAALAAGMDEDDSTPASPQQVPAAPSLPLFPTSASLPPRPDLSSANAVTATTVASTTARDEEKRKATSEEARISLEAIQVEQRKVFISVLGGFNRLLKQSGALQMDLASTQEWDDAKWQSWWIRGWFLELCRLFNKQILANRETIMANVFPDEADPAREIVERAIDMLSE